MVGRNSWILLVLVLAGCSSPPAPSPPNEVPVADAGPDRTVSIGERVEIDGSSSSDSEGESLTYSWTANADNPAHFPLPENSAVFVFTPVADGIYRFELLVSDSKTTSLADSIAITVAASDNTPPVAEAGPNLSHSLGSEVLLSAAPSNDVDGDELTFSWMIVSAPAEITLADTTATQISFTPRVVGSYHLRLIVSDGRDQSADDVFVIITPVENKAPIANAGPDQQVFAGNLVTLDGSLSSDPDGSVALLFQWIVARTPGAAIELSEPSASQPTFIPTEPGEYVFGLVVSDGDSTSIQDVVTVVALAQVFVKRAGMIEIPAGPFVMGSDKGPPDETPPHRVDISTFWIDELEITAGQYQDCVSAGACTPAAASAGCNSNALGRESHPINCIDWRQADSYCTWANKRLPTEAEWEKAARGTDGRPFPWGETSPTQQLLNFGNNVGSTTEVGSYPDGISFYGVHNMGGNVSEWTSDYYAADYYERSPNTDPSGPESSDSRVGRGSSWKIGVPEEALTATVRIRLLESTFDSSIGVRCARTEVPTE